MRTKPFDLYQGQKKIGTFPNKPTAVAEMDKEFFNNSKPATYKVINSDGKTVAQRSRQRVKIKLPSVK